MPGTISACAMANTARPTLWTCLVTFHMASLAHQTIFALARQDRKLLACVSQTNQPFTVRRPLPRDFRGFRRWTLGVVSGIVARGWTRARCEIDKCEQTAAGLNRWGEGKKDVGRGPWRGPRLEGLFVCRMLSDALSAAIFNISTIIDHGSIILIPDPSQRTVQ